MVRLTPPQLELLLAHAAGSDDEVCGVLVGQPGAAPTITHIFAARNQHAAPRAHFLVDAATLLQADTIAQAHGLAIVGFYHSHPDGAAVPSAQDRADAWPDTLLVIVGSAAGRRYVATWHVDAARNVQPVLLRGTS